MRTAVCSGSPRRARDGDHPWENPECFAGARGIALLEREAEIALVGQVLAAASQGQGSLLLVQGPAGIGKSRLLGAARRQAEELGFQVLHARGSEMEREFPHGVVRQLYEPLLASRDEEARTSLFAGAAHLARSFLELRGRRAPRPARTPRQRCTASTG